MPPKPAPNVNTVSLGKFFFNGKDFYVELGSNNTPYPRAAPKHLRGLLLLHTGLLTTQNSTEPSAQWYHAQCIHYGVEPSARKLVSKKRLAEKMVEDGLMVPEWIEEVEQELQERFEEKAMRGVSSTRESSEASEKAGKSSGRTKQTARKCSREKREADMREMVAEYMEEFNELFADEDADDSDYGYPMEEDDIIAETKEEVKGYMGVFRRALAEEQESEDSENEYSSEDSNVFSGSSRGRVQRSPSGRIIQTARKSANSITVTRAQLLAAVPDFEDMEKLRKEITRREDEEMGRATNAKKRKLPPAAKTEVDGSSGTKGKKGKKKQDVVKLHDSMENEDKDFHISSILGDYNVFCPYVLEEWSQYTLDDFSMSITSDKSGLWGSFDFGIFKGIFRSKLPQKLPSTVDVKFRGRQDEGEILFQDKQTEGSITFLKDGKIKGCFHMPAVGSSGRFIGEWSWAPGGIPLKEMKKEWASYSKDNYERESRERWR